MLLSSCYCVAIASHPTAVSLLLCQATSEDEDEGDDEASMEAAAATNKWCTSYSITVNYIWVCAGGPELPNKCTVLSNKSI